MIASGARSLPSSGEPKKWIDSGKRVFWQQFSGTPCLTLVPSCREMVLFPVNGSFVFSPSCAMLNSTVGRGGLVGPSTKDALQMRRGDGYVLQFLPFCFPTVLRGLPFGS